MTTPDRPLQPGTPVLIPAVINSIARDGSATVALLDQNGEPRAAFPLEIVRWHRIPESDGPDAEYVARLEAEVRALEGANTRLSRGYEHIDRELAKVEAERDRKKAAADTAAHMLGEVMAERNAMRPVVAAAEDWRDRWPLLPTGEKLAAAVDTYRARQKAPETAPESPRSDEQPPVAVRSVSGVYDPPLRNWTNGPAPVVADLPSPTTVTPDNNTGRRDWAGEIAKVLGESTGDRPEYWAGEAEGIVTTLGLRKLEAERDKARRKLRRARKRIKAARDALDGLWVNGKIGAFAYTRLWDLLDDTAPPQHPDGTQTASEVGA